MIALLLSLALPAWAEYPVQKQGNYQVTLRPPADGIYAQEGVELEFRLQDTSQPDPLTGFAPVIRAKIDSVLSMPAMPGMPPATEPAHPEGVPGDYGIHPTFAHGGDYRLVLKIAPPGAPPFEVGFDLNVQDARPGRVRKPRFSIDLSTRPKQPKAGEEAELRLIVRDRNSPKIIHSSFEMAHEALMHLVIVSSDLREFAHEHPQRNADGSFTLRHTFPTNGIYRLFADVAPQGAGSQVLSSSLKVSGSSQPRPPAEPTGIKVEAPLGPLIARRTLPLPLTIRDANTNEPALDLQPYLGASGHLMLVHEDAATFVHSHPDEAACGNGRLQFLVRLPKAGRYKGWLQVRRANRILTTELNFQAEEAR